MTHPVDERAGLGIAFKAGQYVTLTPNYLYIATQPSAGRKGYENRLTFDGTVKFDLGGFTFIDRNLLERRLRNSPCGLSSFIFASALEGAPAIANSAFLSALCDAPRASSTCRLIS